MAEPLVIGLDVGGTTSRAWLARGDEIVREASGPTASISTAGLGRACDALRTLLRELEVETVDAVCLGTAGSGSADAQRQLTAAVRDVVSTPSVEVVNDAELLLPAAGFAEGAALVAGTGMKAVGLVRGRRAVGGGWGFLLGDEGSGYWIVREAIRTVLHRLDRAEPPGDLGTRLFAGLGVASGEEIVERFHAEPAPGAWAAHVPLVLATTDPARDRIVADGAAALAARVVDVLETLGAPDDSPVVLAGGVLANSAVMADGVRDALHATWPQLRVVVLREPPVRGAVRLALASAGHV